MDEEVHDLLLGPFRDLLEKAQTAIKTAQGAGYGNMLQAAQVLAREGTRSLKNIEPMANKHLAKYGANFVLFLKDHDGIAEHVDALNELLYDFEDFAEPDTFDASKFNEVGQQAHDATLSISKTLRRIKLEVPQAAAPTSPYAEPRTYRVDSMSTISNVSNIAPASPRLDPLAQSEDAVAGQPRLSAVQHSDTVLHVEDDDQARDGDYPVMGIESGPDLGYNGGSRADSVPQSPTASRRSVGSAILPSPVPEDPPAEPNTNPWQLGARPPIDTIPEGEEDSLVGEVGALLEPNGTIADGEPSDTAERRRRVSARPDSPTFGPLFMTGQEAADGPDSRQRALSSSSVAGPSQPATLRLDHGADAWQQRLDEEERRRQASASASVHGSFINGGSEPPPPGKPASIADRSSSPRMSVVSANWSTPAQLQPPATRGPATYSQQTAYTVETTGSSHTSTSTNGSVFTPTSSDANPNNRGSLVSPVTPGGGPAPHLSGSFAPDHHQNPAPIIALPAIPDRQASPARPLSHDQADLEVVERMPDFEDGLIPVETASQQEPKGPSNEEILAKRAGNCNIGPNSSFHLLKGFCPGAREVINGGKGVRQVQKLSFSGGGNYAAKCTSCFYELQWSDVEKDLVNDPNANYRLHGVGFRLRFLSKSHLPCRSVVDPAYACLFCLQEGRTIEESDATVFFSQSQLFSHLSRHPRPLPHVPGVVVVESAERPPEVRNNYDLHFIHPPVRSQLDGIRRELDQLPTGTAVETFRRTHGSLRRPFDDVVPLQFPTGAKLVGIEFPAKYKGEWGIGWFDNVRAPFPAEAVRLDTPPRTEIRARGTSALRATSRWKWGSTSPYKNSDWLRFDKNETITNIVFANPEHWCWAGTNSRGKWGYFPQSHIEPNSLRETTGASDKASIVSERAGSRLLSRFRSTTYNSNSTGGGGNNGLRRPVSMASTSTSSSH